MRFELLIPLILAASAPGIDGSGVQSSKYPVTAGEAVVDTYHGAKIADPFRWLEDNEAERTRAWIDQENKITQDYLEKCPSREEFRKRLTEVWNYDKVQAPTHRGHRYFFTRLSGLQNQSVLYCADNARGENRKALVDPNSLSKMAPYRWPVFR